MPDPQAMFDIHYFRRDPRPFFKFAREIYPGQFKPSPCHKFIRSVEKHGKLLKNYTQNIDTLEQVKYLPRLNLNLILKKNSLKKLLYLTKLEYDYDKIRIIRHGKGLLCTKLMRYVIYCMFLAVWSPCYQRWRNHKMYFQVF